MKQQFSLRGHKAPVSCITSLDSDLVTSDRDGWMVVWNLITRRPRALWKAHDGHILTLKQTPYGLLTHGRDSSIRLWKVDGQSLSKCSRDSSLLSRSPEPERPPHVEIPVNSLNFSNVDFFGEYLATPATVDSDNLDVYRIQDPFGTFSFSRILENVTISSVQEKPTEIEEVNGPSDAVGRGGHGIIMRLKFISEKLLFVAYESGAVFGLAIENETYDKTSVSDRLVMFKPSKTFKVFSANDHTPSPLLSLEYDESTYQLLTGSASKKLHIYNLHNLMDENSSTGDSSIGDSSDVSKLETHNLRHYGIQCIQVLSDSFVVGFWDGVVRGYSKTFEELFSLERTDEAIKPTFVGKQAPEKKSLCIHSTSRSGGNGQLFKTRKEALHSSRLGTDPLLFIGYGDGLITAFK